MGERMEQFKPGDRIGGEYSVLKVFGGENRSGMGVVYLVKHRELAGPIVLKTFQRAISDEAKRKFISEAQAWITAGAHANIVQAYWVREIAGQLFVAAEYVAPDEDARNTLAHFLSTDPLRPEVILRWAVQFCHGMDYARSKGVVAHRDIKPENLMIDRSGSLKVTDFGLAKSIDLDEAPARRAWWQFGKGQAAATRSKTMTGSALGTLPYMAPEQFVDAKSVDHQADIYSFGIILYQMAAGRYPYRISSDADEPAVEYFRAHASQRPLPLTSPLLPVIDRCLKKEPADRYKSYDALIGDLAAVARELRIKVPTVVHVAKEDEELYAQAQSYVALGDSVRALRAIDEYVSKYPENECGWTEKGRIHFERGEFSEGLAATRKSVALNPYNTHAWNNLGILLNKTGSPVEEIKRAFSNALLFDPHNTAAMMNVIGPLIQRQEYSAAAELISKALKLQPDKPLVRQKAEAVLKECLDKKDLKAAQTLLQGWTEARPSDVSAWHNLGLLSMGAGELDRAIHCFTRVHELTPEDNFAVLQLAKLSFQRKKGRACLDYCNKLLQRNYEPLLAVGLKARVVNLLGGYEAAIACLQPFIDHNPDNDALWVVLAEIHEFRDNHAAAVKALQTAKRILERSPGQHRDDNLAFVTQKLRQLSAAN